MSKGENPATICRILIMLNLQKVKKNRHIIHQEKSIKSGKLGGGTKVDKAH